MEITGLITAIIFGAAIGGFGRLVAPGRHQLSLLVTILVGIVAAVLGTAVAGFIGVADTPGIDWTELALQIIFAGGGVSLLQAAINISAATAAIALIIRIVFLSFRATG